MSLHNYLFLRKYLHLLLSLLGHAASCWDQPLTWEGAAYLLAEWRPRSQAILLGHWRKETTIWDSGAVQNRG